VDDITASGKNRPRGMEISADFQSALGRVKEGKTP
jgi:hypothetical protein